MARINLLHISDLHIAKFPERKEFSPREFLSPGNFKTTARQGTYAASYSTGKLEAVVSLAHKVKDSLDAIVITGDIATTGLEHDLEKARIFIEGPPNPEDPRFSEDGIATISGVGVNKIILLPGNHDRYHELRDPSGLVSLGYAPGNKKFHHVFRQHWQNDVKTTVVDNDGLAVVVCAADFSLRRWRDAHLPQPANWYAQGRIYRESGDVLPELVSQTQASRDDCLQRDLQVVIIWALHFPPAFPNGPSYMKLLGEEYLIAAAKECGVACILVGHTHKQVAYPLPNCYVLCAGSASQADVKDGNYCQIISIDNANQDAPLMVATYRLEARNDKLEFVKALPTFG